MAWMSQNVLERPSPTRTDAKVKPTAKSAKRATAFRFELLGEMLDGTAKRLKHVENRPLILEVCSA